MTLIRSLLIMSLILLAPPRGWASEPPMAGDPTVIAALSKPTLEICLNASDAASSERFFKEGLEFAQRPEPRGMRGGGMRMLMFEAGSSGSVIKVRVYPTPPSRKPAELLAVGGIRVVTLRVEKLDEIVARLRQLGFEAAEPKSVDGVAGIRSSLVRNGDGTAFELVEAAAERGQKAPIEIGLVVRDLAAAKAFFIGMYGAKELPAQDATNRLFPGKPMARFATREGPGTIFNLWSPAADVATALVDDAGKIQESLGFRYITHSVRDTATLHDAMKAAQATIDTPLSAFGNTASLFMVRGPGGAIFEFVGPPTEKAGTPASPPDRAGTAAVPPQVRDMFQRVDRDGNGVLDRDELSQRPALVRLLTSADTDSDGALSRDEVRAASARFPTLSQLLDDPASPAAPREADRERRPRQPLNNAPIDPKWGPDIEPKKSSIAFTFEPDFTPGTKDAAGNVLGGTELMRLSAYDGKLFAAVGYFGQDPAKRRPPGGQILRKDAADGPWVVEATFPDYVRVDTLVEAMFTADADGKPLATPVRMLVAGLWWKKVKPWGTPEDERTSVAVRDSATGKWTVVTIGIASGGSPGNVRALQMHTDRVTGRQYLFAGCGDGKIYRGVFDAAAPGQLRWEVDPGLPKTARLVCLTVCDGTLFVAGGLVENNGETPSRGRVTAEEIRREGGLYRRVDGTESRWELVYRWPFAGPRFNEHLMRGISVVPDPADPTKNVILGGLEDPPLIVRVDPATGKATDELNFMKYFQRVFGGRPNPGRWVNAVMHNQLEPFTDPRTGEKMHLATTYIVHPKNPEAPHNGAWLLIRRLDGSYEHAEIYPKGGTAVLPSRRSLNGARTIIESPFPEERGRVWYFGGYGAEREFMHDTAWIYKGMVTGR